MEKGRKIPEKDENQIDNLIYKYIVEPISPILYSLHITPNMVTMMSFICGLLSVYYLYHKKYTLSAISYLFGYILDCVDGYLARKYDQITKFGDYFDHISDSVINIMIVYIFLCRKKYYKIVIILIFLILTSIHLSCQEKIYNKKENSDTLNLLNNIYECKDVSNIKYTKYFGCGTYNLIVIIMILLP
jgi:phosphatidylglycerophosphate synthase